MRLVVLQRIVKKPRIVAAQSLERQSGALDSHGDVRAGYAEETDY